MDRDVFTVTLHKHALCSSLFPSSHPFILHLCPLKRATVNNWAFLRWNIDNEECVICILVAFLPLWCHGIVNHSWRWKNVFFCQIRQPKSLLCSSSSLLCSFKGACGLSWISFIEIHYCYYLINIDGFLLKNLVTTVEIRNSLLKWKKHRDLANDNVEDGWKTNIGMSSETWATPLSKQFISV